MALNFKGLDYKTVWLEYPDVESTLRPHVLPNDPPNASYTIPAVQIGSDYIMDSRNIAARLEKDHPTPSLHLDSPLLPVVYEIIPSILDPIRANWMPLVPQNLLNPRSAEYFTRTREERFGKTFEELRVESGGEEGWIEAMSGIKSLGRLLAQEDGPFFMGKTASYMDFVVVGLLHFYHRIDERLFKKVLDIEPALGVLYDASKPWLERDDY